MPGKTPSYSVTHQVEWSTLVQQTYAVLPTHSTHHRQYHTGDQTDPPQLGCSAAIVTARIRKLPPGIEHCVLQEIVDLLQESHFLVHLRRLIALIALAFAVLLARASVSIPAVRKDGGNSHSEQHVA